MSRPIGAGDLRCRIQLYARVETENELGEMTYEYASLRTAWARLVPQSGSRGRLEGGMERPEITHKATVRAGVLPEIPADLYFTYRGQRYDVLYGYPIYDRSGWLELYCRLVVDRGVKSN